MLTRAIRSSNNMNKPSSHHSSLSCFVMYRYVFAHAPHNCIVRLRLLLTSIFLVGHSDLRDTYAQPVARHVYPLYAFSFLRRGHLATLDRRAGYVSLTPCTNNFNLRTHSHEYQVQLQTALSGYLVVMLSRLMAQYCGFYLRSISCIHFRPKRPVLLFRNAAHLLQRFHAWQLRFRMTSHLSVLVLFTH